MIPFQHDGGHFIMHSNGTCSLCSSSSFKTVHSASSELTLLEKVADSKLDSCSHEPSASTPDLRLLCNILLLVPSSSSRFNHELRVACTTPAPLIASTSRFLCTHSKDDEDTQKDKTERKRMDKMERKRMLDKKSFGFHTWSAVVHGCWKTCWKDLIGISPERSSENLSP
jgi:hypothetical protein